MDFEPSDWIRGLQVAADDPIEAVVEPEVVHRYNRRNPGRHTHVVPHDSTPMRLFLPRP